MLSSIFFSFSDSAGARTQDPYIKSVLLYQLSYRVFAFLQSGCKYNGLFKRTKPISQKN